MKQHPILKPQFMLKHGDGDYEQVPAHEYIRAEKKAGLTHIGPGPSRGVFHDENNNVSGKIVAVEP